VQGREGKIVLSKGSGNENSEKWVIVGLRLFESALRRKIGQLSVLEFE
jgi:hypothetical protein